MLSSSSFSFCVFLTGNVIPKQSFNILNFSKLRPPLLPHFHSVAFHPNKLLVCLCNMWISVCPSDLSMAEILVSGFGLAFLFVSPQSSSSFCAFVGQVHNMEIVCGKR